MKVLFIRIYMEVILFFITDKPMFKVGDKVRISKVKWKGTFDKGYLPNQTTELFTFSKVLNTNSVTCKIKDWNDEEVKGSFLNLSWLNLINKMKIMKQKRLLKQELRMERKSYM